ncbi:phage holin family protein [Mumia zhuanghuii]|uniref:Phosphodiesterase n=1 Tax=Mumia zhuanghuii TaxID=2585211 RepID=A0A5C4MCY0_9ACTN|nr:phage holin family protein [Mumia zhuanghuii]TNC31187.1 phosphodiesterase [Mumia zhuanghuii]TNC44952.1 phosphodiesterase [Mumia zhuanghuii]
MSATALRRLRIGDAVRLLLAWAGATATLAVVGWVLDDLEFTAWWTPAVAAAVTGLVGLVLQPLFVSVAARIGWLAVVALAVVGQAVVVAVALAVVPGVVVESWWAPLIAAWLAALVGSLLAWISTAGTDEGFAVALARRGRRSRQRDPASTEDGLLVVQLDGVAYPVLTWALAAGNMPTLERWLREGSHTLHEWRPTTPCTTPASQLGILHRAADRVPAFRWYDRELGRVLTANHPADAAVIEHRASGVGLLADGGVSVSNIFSGGADRTAMVMSRLRSGRGTTITREAVAWFVVRPDGLARSLFRTLGEIVRERAQALRQVRRDVRPRVRRDWTFAVLRAGSNGVVRDLSTAVVAQEMLRGTPIVYVDYVDYDEVAHHAGVFRRESLAALEALDGVLGTLETVAAQAGRRYRIAVVSDHGQSQGATFLQVHGATLADLVGELTSRSVEAVQSSDEDYARLRALAEEMAGNGSGTARRAAARMDRATGKDPSATSAPGGEQSSELIVLASGNLGLVHARTDRRLVLAEIDERWPRLVPGLVNHPAIGCVVAMTVDEGPVAIGPDGIVALRTGDLAGDTDPLAAYGEGARERLLPTSEQPEAPDLYVISACDPATGTVHAFEELVGSHGGLGGWQDRAVLLAPAGLTPPPGTIVGADAVHDLLRGWRDELTSPRPRDVIPSEGSGPQKG